MKPTAVALPLHLHHDAGDLTIQGYDVLHLADDDLGTRCGEDSLGEES